MMSSHTKLISSLAVLASSIAIVSPLELGESATLPLHLAPTVQAPEQALQSTSQGLPAHSPLAEIAAQVRSWESNEHEDSRAKVATPGEGEAEQESRSIKHLDKSFRQYVFNKYGGFFFGEDEG